MRQRRPAEGHYLVLVAHDLPPSTTYLKRFAKATGVRPTLITYFQNFGKPFSASDACMVTGQGALPFSGTGSWSASPGSTSTRPRTGSWKATSRPSPRSGRPRRPTSGSGASSGAG